MGTETRTTSSTGGQKGVKEERHDLIPIGPLRELATHFGRGALKYDTHQWRVGYEWSKSYSALDRHLKLFWQGEDYDVCSNEPENCLQEHPVDGRPWPKPGTDTCWNHTGSHHMVAVAWHAFVLLEFKDRFPYFDDRYKTETNDAGEQVTYEQYVKDMEDLETSRSKARFFQTLGVTYNYPERLSWVAKNGETSPVCICSEEDRAAQGDIAKHYLVIHNVKL